MLNAIEIFKAGRHTATSGEVVEFTEAMLQATAAAYNPAIHEAPLVLGHPKTDDPRYGGVKSIAYADRIMSGTPGYVDAGFAELVEKKYYTDISSSFYTPDSPLNPVPGVYYLRHVGFLGAHPPAVKGLNKNGIKLQSFADHPEGVIEFGDFGDQQNAGMWRRLRDWLIGQFGLDTADKVIPDYAVATLEDAARTEPKTEDASPAYAEQPTEEDKRMNAEQAAKEAALKKQAEEHAARDVQFAEREKKLRDEEQVAARKSVVEFADGLVKAGKLLPRDQAGLVEFMAALSAESVIEFGEGADRAKKPAAGWLREFLTALPVQVDYAERSAASADTANAKPAPRVPHGYSVDVARQELHTKALAYAEQNKTDYLTAISAVSN